VYIEVSITSKILPVLANWFAPAALGALGAFGLSSAAALPAKANRANKAKTVFIMTSFKIKYKWVVKNFLTSENLPDIKSNSPTEYRKLTKLAKGRNTWQAFP
jgi:hypothetical protein